MPLIRRTIIFKKWLESLKDENALVAIDRRLERIKIDGYIGKTKPVVGVKNISEIKIETGKGYRIYFNLYIKDDEVWLLSGGDKSTQTKDIEVAKRLLQEILEERGAKK
jgi:putative addiction module killer protein